MRKRKQRLCCICKKRPVYYNNGLLWKVCKRCYHKQVWVHRPSIMKARKMGLPTPSDDELRAFRLSMIARARCPRGKLKEVMTPAHDKWNEFCERLEGPEGCNFQMNSQEVTWQCGGGTDKSRAKAILKSMGNMDIKGSMEYFEEHGGCCDCEILYNIAAPLKQKLTP